MLAVQTAGQHANPACKRCLLRAENVCIGSGRAAEPSAVTREGTWGFEGRHEMGLFQKKPHTTGELNLEPQQRRQAHAPGNNKMYPQQKSSSESALGLL